MTPQVALQLVDLNRQFYDRFAPEYSQSRMVLQPGILRALEALGAPESLVDVGCGDGRLATGLPETTHYVGVDASPGLLAQWRGGENAPRVQADITVEGWGETVPRPPGGFASGVCLSALHHVPGATTRVACVREIASLLRPAAPLVVSVWQFMEQERFQRKQVDWSEIGLTPDDVDPGDVLLDWQRGGRGIRYLHAFTAADLRTLCIEAGLEVLETWRSDGVTHDLGLYILARRP